MSILLLGNSGFLGQAVKTKLEKKKLKYYAASKSNYFNLLNLDDANSIVSETKPDFIINCAALTGGVHYVQRNVADVFDVNVRIVLNLYNAISRFSPKSIIINPIANCVYSPNLGLLKEDEILLGVPHKSVQGFAESRRLLINLSKFYYIQYSIRSKNWIVPNIYGPGDIKNPEKTHFVNGMIIRMIKSLMKKQDEFELWGDGKAKREIIYVEDVAELLLLSLNLNSTPAIEPINMAKGISHSVMDIARLIAKELKYSGAFKTKNTLLEVDPVRIMDNKRFRETYPNFKFTPLIKGIKSTIDYYKSIF